MQPKGGLAFMLVVGGAIKIAHFAIVFGLRLDDVICLPKTVGDFSATTSDKDNTASDVRSIFVDFDLTPHQRSPKCSLNWHRAKLSGIFFDICIYRGPQKYNQQNPAHTPCPIPTYFDSYSLASVLCKHSKGIQRKK